jgi:hypothetical protein
MSPAYIDIDVEIPFFLIHLSFLEASLVTSHGACLLEVIRELRQAQEHCRQS